VNVSQYDGQGRVAVYVPAFPAPSETFVVNQIEGLVEAGLRVDVVAKSAGSNPEAAGERLGLREVRFQRPLAAGRFRRMLGGARLAAGLARRHPAVAARSLDVVRHGRAAASLRLLYAAEPFVGERYDVVYCHFGPMGLQAVRLRQTGALRGRVVTVFHGFDVSNTIKLRGPDYYADLFEHGDLLLPVSEYWRRRLIELGADPDRILVHRMGIDLPDAIDLTHHDMAETVQLASVARLVEKKGIEYALEALARLPHTPAWRYTIVGDGEERNALERLATDLGIADRVRFTGWQQPDEVDALLRRSHVFVAPSVTARNGDQEGIPVAIMEAMGRGLPVISTIHTGIPELVEDGRSGYLVAERAAKALSDAIARLIGDVHLRKTLGARGREIVAAQHDIRSLNRRLVELLLDGTAAT